MDISIAFIEKLLFEGYHSKKAQTPISGLLDLFKDKWSFLILLHLTQHTNLRFGEIQRKLPPISNKVLSKSLFHLEKTLLIKRKEFNQFPLRVEYTCTARGIKFFRH